MISIKTPETMILRNGIEDTYKKVNNGEWGWRALRLMSRRSTHFFIAGLYTTYY